MYGLWLNRHPFQHSADERNALEAEQKTLEAEIKQRSDDEESLSKVIQEEHLNQVRLKERISNGQGHIKLAEDDYLKHNKEYMTLLADYKCKSLADVDRLSSYDRQINTPSNYMLNLNTRAMPTANIRNLGKSGSKQSERSGRLKPNALAFSQILTSS